MRNKYIVFFLFMFCACCLIAQEKDDIPRLENPMSVHYLKKKLKKAHPRLVLNSSIEKKVKQKIQSDPVSKNYYAAIKLNAEKIKEKPYLERIVTGRRLLSVSREMLYRVNMLGMVYRMEKDPETLHRLNNELVAVCNFTDWNPSHYLDVAEMSLAVALAIDWGWDALPKETIEMAIDALIEKVYLESKKLRKNGFKGVIDEKDSIR